MKVGIIGYGFVGGATAEVLKEHHELVIYDKYKKEYENGSVLKDCDVIFICVPTPMQASGEIDYYAVRDSLNTLGCFQPKTGKQPVIIIRSTAVSGTTKFFEEMYPYKFAFNPEFLREKYAVEDMKNAKRIVIGCRTAEVFNICCQVYAPAYKDTEFICVDTETAEMVKYAANVMLTGQIAIANEIYQICKTVGVDYETVKATILRDERIGRNIDVPGPDGDLGFGGKCFPKDLNALIYLAREHMYRPYLLEEIWRLNEKVRSKKDWLDIKGATSKNNF